jgi:hypothetical protein
MDPVLAVGLLALGAGIGAATALVVSAVIVGARADRRILRLEPGGRWVADEDIIDFMVGSSEQQALAQRRDLAGHPDTQWVDWR